MMRKIFAVALIAGIAPFGAALADPGQGDPNQGNPDQSSPIQQQDGVGSSGHRSGDLVQVELHGFGVGVGHRQTGSRAAGRTNGSEQVGAVVAMIGRLAWARSASGPLPHDPVLMPQAHLILEPDLHPLTLSDTRQMSAQGGGEVFLNSVMVRSS